MVDMTRYIGDIKCIHAVIAQLKILLDGWWFVTLTMHIQVCTLWTKSLYLTNQSIASICNAGLCHDKLLYINLRLAKTR